MFKWLHFNPVKCACVLLCTFLVLFPKGGVKVSDIPVTWGYVLVMVFAILALPAAILDRRCFQIPRLTFVVFACLIPFQCLLMFSMSNGMDSIGYSIAGIINFFVLPVIILLIWRRWYTDDIIAFLLPVLRSCVTAAAAYGVFLFFYRIVTGNFIEVPYLTVNADDIGLLEGTKDIARGDSGNLFKLISTYNNGNLYGISMLLILPVYNSIQSRKFNKVLIRVALLLTLSRTVWAGLVLEQTLTAASSLMASLRYFPKVNVRAVLRLLPRLFMIVAIIGTLIGLAYMYDLGGLSFVTDNSLGGRDDQLAVLHNFSLLPKGPYTGFSEMVFLSALKQLGLVGLLSMLLLFLCPLLFSLIDNAVLASPIRRAAVKGLMLYFAVAWIDGAINLIPVMAFYWFVVVLAVYGKDIPGTPARTFRGDANGILPQRILEDTGTI